MKLNSHKPNVVVQPRSQNLDWSVDNGGFKQSQQFQADTWVHLLELPSTYSYDEALLLCQSGEDEWVAWIPNHGEAVLHSSQFSCLPLIQR
jgi:hypothetical protein